MKNLNTFEKEGLQNTADALTPKQKEFRKDPGKWFRENTPTKPFFTTNLYDEDFLDATLFLLQSQLDDLDTWSVYNQDKFNEEISIIKKALELIKEKGNI